MNSCSDFEKLLIGVFYCAGSFDHIEFITLWQIITFWDFRSWSSSYENIKPTLFNSHIPLG